MIRIIVLCFVLTGCMSVHVITENGDNDSIEESEELSAEIEGV